MMSVIYMCFWSVCSVVRDDWRDQENFLVYKAWRPVLASTQPLLQWLLVAPMGPGYLKLNFPNTLENTGLLYLTPIQSASLTGNIFDLHVI